MSRREEGFTLIELAVAVGLFGTVMISMSLLFQSAFRTTNQVRFGETAKTLAQEKLEEIRSLPFHVSQRTNTADVDVLDRYFPWPRDAATPTGAAGDYDGAANTWTFTSTETVDEEDAPPFTRTVVAQFVAPTEDDLVPVAPAIGYDSDVVDKDAPSADALKVTVTVAWTTQGRDRSVSLDTVLFRTEREEVKVEASGSVLGVQVTGLGYRDGDDSGVDADLVAQVAQAQTEFREVEASATQGSTDSVRVVERDPDTNAAVQAEVPTDDAAAATAPNATTGSTDAGSATMAAGTMSSLGAPASVIAAWGPASPSGATEARVSVLHTQNPEGRAQVNANLFELNSRDQGDAAPRLALAVAAATGTVEQRSTDSQASVTATMDLTGVGLWGQPPALLQVGFAGTVTIESVHVEAGVVAGASTVDSDLDWEVRGLRVWDPLVEVDGVVVGGYAGPWTFGFDSDCGGWVDDPALCGPARTDGLAPLDNPNPVVIPQAYQGTDPDGNPASSLVIVAGASAREFVGDASLGVSTALAAQKNVLSITMSDDVSGAVALEPMSVGLGDVSARGFYVQHEH